MLAWWESVPAVILAAGEWFWHAVGCKLTPAAAGGVQLQPLQQARGAHTQHRLKWDVWPLTFVLLGQSLHRAGEDASQGAKKQKEAFSLCFYYCFICVIQHKNNEKRRVSSLLSLRLLIRRWFTEQPKKWVPDQSVTRLTELFTDADTFYSDDKIKLSVCDIRLSTL